MYGFKRFLYHPDGADAGGAPPATTPAAEQQQQQPATQTANKPAGEKTFTQAEVDQIVRDRLARAKPPESTAEQQPAADKSQDNAIQAQLAAMQQTVIQAKIEAQMAISGIQAEKVGRACRLIDTAKCAGKNGQPDAEKIKVEIEALIKDFPELKSATAEGAAGFKIGADGTAKDKNNTKESDIARAFGIRERK